MGLWTGAWKVKVTLENKPENPGELQHLHPSNLPGPPRGCVYYQGHSKLCHKYGEKAHLIAQCKVKVCAICTEKGHLAENSEKEWCCNPCREEEYVFKECLGSYANAVKKDRKRETATPTTAPHPPTKPPKGTREQEGGRGRQRGGNRKGGVPQKGKTSPPLKTTRKT